MVHFEMENCNPIECGAKLSSVDSPKIDQEMERMERIPYQQAVGSLMGAMVYTRPDLSYALNQVAKFMSNPGLAH